MMAMALGSWRSTVSMLRNDVVSSSGTGGCTPAPTKTALYMRRMGVFGGGSIQSSCARRAQSKGPRDSRRTLPAATTRQGSCA